MNFNPIIITGMHRSGTSLLSQILMYAAPIVWPISLFQEKFGESMTLLYGLYPMVGVIEGFRAILLNTANMQPVRCWRGRRSEFRKDVARSRTSFSTTRVAKQFDHSARSGSSEVAGLECLCTTGGQCYVWTRWKSQTEETARRRSAQALIERIEKTLK